MTYHNPVLLDESIEGLEIAEDGIYVDVTFGGGGHSAEILKKLVKGKLFAFDQDPDSEANKIDDERFVLIHASFVHMKRYLKYFKSVPVDGILADLGVSSHQFDVAERGFSTRFESELDMRMNPAMKISAKDIVNTYTADQLKKIFSEYGEIHNAGKLTQCIVKARESQPVNTVTELKQAAAPCVQFGKENQYYAKMFQALRIEVNDELNVLKELLMQSAQIMRKGGRLAVISYHSMEDRIVKNFINKGKFEGEVEKDVFGNPADVPFTSIYKKPLTVSEAELKINPRSRSAKLRVAEKN